MEGAKKGGEGRRGKSAVGYINRTVTSLIRE